MEFYPFLDFFYFSIFLNVFDFIRFKKFSENYDQARALSQLLSEIGDTEAEEEEKAKKAMKRQRIVADESLDLRSDIKAIN